jgi:phage-related minor tail protein
MAEGVNVANAFVTVMPSMEGAQSAITEAILPAASATGDKAGTTMGSMLTGKLGKAVTAFAAGFTIEKAFSGIMQVGEGFESLKNSIVRNTGASGAALDDMENSAEQVFTTVPVSLDAAGSIVESLTQRMGLSGDTLTEVAKKIAVVQKMTGTAVDMSTLTGTFNLFGIAAENVSGEMDTMYAITQNTGIGFNDLLSTLQTSGPAMNELGFSMDTTAEMAGALSKAGLDANGVLSKMAKALPTLEEGGEDAGATFNRLKSQMQDYIAQGNDSAALDIASNLFGTRGATQFLAAVKSGAMNIEDLGSLAQSASGDIMQTSAATGTWQGKLQLLENKLSAALEPLAGGILDGITDSFKDIAGSIGSIDPSTMQTIGAELGSTIKDGLSAAADIVKWVIDNGPLAKDIAIGIGTAFVAIKISSFISGIGNAARGMMGFLSVLAANPIVLVVAAIAALVAGLVYFFTQTETGREMWSSFTGWLSSTWQSLSSGFMDIWGGVVSWFQGAWNGTVSWFSGVWSGVQAVFSAVADAFSMVWQGVVLVFQVVFGAIAAYIQLQVTVWSVAFEIVAAVFTAVWQGAQIVFQAVWDFFTAYVDTEITGWQIIFQAVGDFFTAVWQGASGAVSGIVGGITGFFSAAGSDVQSIWQGVVDWFSGVPDAIGGFFGGLADLLSAPFRNAFDNIRSFWNSTIGGFGITIPDWIPAIGGQSFSIPYLASGGIVDSAQLAMIGEAGPEVVTPLSKIQPIVNKAVESSEPKSSGMSDVSAKLDKLINTLGQTIRENAPTVYYTPREAQMVTREALRG